METHREENKSSYSYRWYYCTRRKILFSSLLLCSVILFGSCEISNGQFPGEIDYNYNNAFPHHRFTKRSPVMSSTSTSTTPTPFVISKPSAASFISRAPSSSYYSLFPTTNSKNVNTNADQLENNNQLIDSPNGFLFSSLGINHNKFELPQFLGLNGNVFTGKIKFPLNSSGQNKIFASDAALDVDSSPFKFPESATNSVRSGRTIDFNTNRPPQVGNGEEVVDDGATTTLSPLFRPGPKHLSPSLPLSSIASSVESSRKASPDVQDIIDGIVKLLGGKVHNGQTTNSNQQQQSQQPQSSRPYNLFNPTKPLFLTTPRPTRINNRGPVLGSANSNGIQNLNSAEFQLTPQQQQQTFEAIPLEALNNGFNLNQSKFGPPFPLSQIGQDAPYKQGVPLPEQIVPAFQQGSSHPNNQQASIQNNHFNHNNNNNRNRPPQRTPTEEYFGIPSSGESSAGFHTRPHSNTNSNINNAHIYHHVSTNSGERFSSSTASPTTGVYDYFNQNVQLQNGAVSTKRPAPQTPTTLLVPTSSLENNLSIKESGEKLSPINVSNNNGNNKYNNNDPSMSPLLITTIPEEQKRVPLQTQLQTDSIEDDEKEQQHQQQGQDETLTEIPALFSIPKPNSQETIAIPPPQPLEPTITESSTHFPTFVLDSSPSYSSTFSSEISFINPFNDIKPSAASTSNHMHMTIEPTKVAIISSSSSMPPTFSAPFTNSPTTLETNWPITTKSPATRKPQLPVYYNNNKNNNGNRNNGFESLSSTTTTTGLILTEQSNNNNGVIPTPPLRPGIVIHEGNPASNSNTIIKGQGFGSVEVVTNDDGNSRNPSQQIGDIFDITVTAKQGFGVQEATGQPFITQVEPHNDEIITAPHANVNQQFVSIDGKRTYFNLHPSSAISAIGSATPTKLVDHLVPAVVVPPVKLPARITTTTSSVSTASTSSQSPPKQASHPGFVGEPTHPFAPKTNSNAAVPSRAVSTSLSIQSGGSNSASNPVNKAPPNIIRRPLSRKPSIPPVRIDTCIVGDDSTCNSEQSEVCRTDNGVSACICRPGYARRRHREPCRAILTLVMSIKMDKIGDKKLTYDPEYFNSDSEIYQSLEWETIHGIDSIISETPMQSSYVGAKLDSIGFDGRFAVVNSTILIQDNPKVPTSQIKRELQRNFIQILSKHRNNFGKTQLWVEEPVSAISAINDVDECENSELNDCDVKANCINTFGSFECKCEPGYGDHYEKDRRRSGKKCEGCNGKLHCNGRGECAIENSQRVCKCVGNYWGSQCDIDGEVMAVAIGASISALVIIGLTLVCLCMWSRRWKREEQKAALMSRTLFGGMATQALSYISNKNSMSGGNPYQQHVGLDDRLRWAQVNDTSMTGNIYVQNEPLSLHASPTALLGASLMDTPPMMSTRRSSDTCDTTVDDLFEERHPTKRPKSRSSQMQPGGGGGSIYYDLEPDNDIYSTRQQPPTLVPFSQFCVPMNPYSHSRGFYN